MVRPDDVAAGNGPVWAALRCVVSAVCGRAGALRNVVDGEQ